MSAQTALPLLSLLAMRKFKLVMTDTAVLYEVQSNIDDSRYNKY